MLPKLQQQHIAPSIDGAFCWALFELRPVFRLAGGSHHGQITELPAISTHTVDRV